MTTIRRCLGSVLVVAALALLTTLFSAGVAHAQCPGVKVTNQTNCTINLCLYDAISGAVICQIIPAGAVNFPYPFPAAFVLGGVQSTGLILYPFPAQPPSPGCSPCINLGPAGATCCCIVCFDKPTCRMRIQPCAAPCLP